MTLCTLCQNGKHPHDRWPDGSGADCPMLAANHRHPDDGCTCPVRLPQAESLHRCSCGNVHNYGATS